MAKLTASTRNALPSSDFVFPNQRKYPIEDASHARNALSRASAQGGKIASKVKASVKSKYPDIGKKKPTPADEGRKDMMMKQEAARRLK